MEKRNKTTLPPGNYEVLIERIFLCVGEDVEESYLHYKFVIVAPEGYAGRKLQATISDIKEGD